MEIIVTWKKAAIAVAVAVFFIAGSFFAGKNARPDSVEQHAVQDTKIEYRFVERQDIQEKFTVDMSKVAKTKVNSHTEKKIRELIDGTKETTETTDTTEETEVAESNRATIDESIHSETQGEAKAEEHKAVDTKIVNNAHSGWSVGIDVSLSLGDFHLDNPTGNLVYGISLSRELFWGLRAFGHLDTQKVVSVGLEKDF